MSALVWRTLGIASTNDIAAIRSAYATALKAMDVDADPARFEALRKARDQALALARSGATAVAENDADTAPPSGDGIAVPIDDRLKTSLRLRTAPDAESAPSPHGLTVAPVAPDPESHRPPPAPAPEAPEQRSLPEVAPGFYTLTPPILPGGHENAALETGDPAGATPYQDHYRAVLGLLFAPEGEQPQPLGPDGEAMLVQHVQALLHDPRMEEIAFHAEAERWFAQIIAAAIPRSDPIVDMVTEHFGWLADRGRIDQPPAVAAVVARHDSLDFLRRIRKRDHKFHKTWLELTRPASENSRRGMGTNHQKVRVLLAKVRRDHPDLEQLFDWYRVSLWEDSRASSGARGWWIGFVVLGYIIVSTIGNLVSPSDRRATDPIPAPVYAPGIPAPSEGFERLISADNDLAEVFRNIAGDQLNTDLMRDRNPKLYAMLETNWRLARENERDRNAYIRDTGKQLLDRYDASLDRATYPVIAQYRQLSLDQAKAFRAISPTICDNFFKGGDVPFDRLPPNFSERSHALIARVLLETYADPRPRPADRTFSYFRSTGEDAARRAGLPYPTFAKALSRGGGTAATRCAARIGLIEAALALPRKEGLDLLRAM